MPRLLLVVPVLLACVKGHQLFSPSSAPAQIQTRVALSKATSCDDLTKNVQDTAVRQMRMQLEAEKAGGWWGVPLAAGAATPSSASAPASYTSTNTQVAGVDEADFVKNDGTRILVLSGKRLFTATSWPPQSLALAGQLEIEGWPASMFLDGNQVVVFSLVWTQPPAGNAGLCAIGAPCPFYGGDTTKITVVDVSDLSNPKAAAEVYLPGYSEGARRIGSSVRLVLSDNVRWPDQIKWWPDYDPAIYQSKDKFAQAIAALEDANEAIIRATPLAHWFPDGRRKLPDGTSIDIGYQCSDFYLANAPEKLGLVTIATLDLAHLDAGVSRASIVGEAGVLYATQSRLYLASRHWWWWPWAGQRDWTYVHAFDIANPASAAYVGSGGVEGTIGDQFAMDEKDGYLRIATSTSDWTQDAQGLFHAAVGSRLSVLAPQSDGSLKLLSEVAPLVAGERLMAVRFTGDKGYAVTFRNVDPLATLDLADPAHPKKVAELTLPGFSTYLQPVDDGHLLAIGVDVAVDTGGNVDWNKRAIALSLFDVSDLSQPKRTAQLLVGTAWAYSEALWDHYAFNWYRPDAAKPGLLAIPFSDWLDTQPWWTGFVSDVRVFSVDTAGSISAVGSLGMNDVYLQQGTGQWTWWYRPWVRRSVMATDRAGNTFVYAVSDAGIRSAALSHLDTPLATVIFPNH